MSMSELLHVGYNDFCKILQKYVDILPRLFLGILSLVAILDQVDASVDALESLKTLEAFETLPAWPGPFFPLTCAEIGLLQWSVPDNMCKPTVSPLRKSTVTMWHTFLWSFWLVEPSWLAAEGHNTFPGRLGHSSSWLGPSRPQKEHAKEKERKAIQNPVLRCLANLNSFFEQPSHAMSAGTSTTMPVWWRIYM